MLISVGTYVKRRNSSGSCVILGLDVLAAYACTALCSRHVKGGGFRAAISPNYLLHFAFSLEIAVCLSCQTEMC